MRIGLLGGSFDPIHNGHLEMAKQSFKQLQLDEIWFLIAKDTPLKTRKLTCFMDREKMVEKAIKPFRHFKICTIENELSGKSYTIDTIHKLKKEFPNFIFYFMMGEDQVSQLNEWKDIDILQEEVYLCAFERDKKKIKTKYKVQSLHMDMFPISSTKIRAGRFMDLPKGVKKYIVDKHLYETFIKNSMSEFRYQHSIRVANLCKEIAIHNGLDKNKAYLCGLLHDINKEYKIIALEPSKKIIQRVKPELLSLPESIWHGFMGRFICIHRLGVKDKDVLVAIENHVLGECKGRYAKVLYLADKLDPNRDYDTSPMITLSYKNYHLAYAVVKKQQNEFYQGRNTNGK